MLNKKHNLKSGKKNKYKKRDSKEKARQETQKREKIDEKMQLNVLMLFLSWNKSKEETKKKETKRRN